MEFALTPEQEQFAEEFRSYLKAHLTPALRAEMEHKGEMGKSPLHKEFIRQMGRDGWLGIGWPREYGGQGRAPMEQHIFYEIVAYERIMLPLMALNAVGPALMRYGSDEMKAEILPRILRGELEVAIGYTEPEAGTDLASLKTTAVRDGGHYVINGQKVFTSCAEYADYLWIAARTDPHAAKKHHGISVFFFPMNTAGITIEPMWLLGGERNNSTFYDNVRVPTSCLVGEENKGWKYITTQLDFERIALNPSSPMRRNIDDTIGWARETSVDGSPVLNRPWVRTRLAELIMNVEVLKMLNYYVAWLITAGIVPYAEASMVKVFGAELYQRVNHSLIEIMGEFGQLQSGSKWAPLKGRIEQDLRSDVILTFGGGASEIQRNIIAMAGLGMPRST
ncbi:MAG: acyl-CoA dehydrogenase family protein [Dehalococcoidia bacterium]|nr:acyl-CoA dehydrogenase family protein [Dehalococcoidia bacterium]